MDQDNPAVSSLTKMPPALLADLGDNPSILKGIATVMSAVQLEGLHRVFNNPTTPTGQKIQIFEATSKIAELGAYGKATNNGQVIAEKFSLSINVINQAAPTPTKLNTSAEVVEMVDVTDVTAKDSNEAPADAR